MVKMNKEIETALRALNREFRVIKKSLENIPSEVKRINSIEIELKRVKSEIIPKKMQIERNSS